MRRIDRYISREVLSHAALGLLIFTFVLFVPQLVKLMELLVRHGGGADAGTVAMLVACAMPQVLTFTAPMAVLVGVMIGLGRMSADSEIIALHALGISLRRILLSVGVVAVGGALLTLTMTMWLGPAAVRKFRDIEQRLRTTQASFEVQPRVFDERFPGVVLYVQDVEAAGTRWRGLLLAESNARFRTQDSTDKARPAARTAVKRVTLAEEAVVIADRRAGRLQLHLRNGSTHEFAPDQPERYNVTTFGHSDLPITVAAPAAAGTAQARERTPAERTPAELWQATRAAEASDEARRAARVELHRRVALPLACLVFALAGVPMGARPRRGGRAAGFVVTLLLICGYYLLFVTGAGLAQRGSVAPWLGLWAANLVTAAAALVSLPRVEQVHHEGLFTRWAEAFAPLFSKLRRASAAPHPNGATNGSGVPRTRPAAAPAAATRPAARRRARSFGAAIGFPLLLDFHLLRQFCGALALVLAGFILLFESFTFFELIGDITSNSIAPSVVAQYFIFLTPHLLYQTMPLAALVAALAAFGLLAKHNEVTAFKASGISLYRLSAPLLLAAALLAVGMFAMDSTFLPYSNQRQDALRNLIKQRPAQTFYQPRGHWIFGSPSSSVIPNQAPNPSFPSSSSLSLYNYEYFDPDQNRFAGLTIIQLHPATFQLLQLAYASRAHWEPAAGKWVLFDGWVRHLDSANGAPFRHFSVQSLAEFSQPPDYFKRDVRPAYQMSAPALAAYIADLQFAGFDVARLSTHLHRKFAYPLLAPVIVLLAIPFAFLVGSRGATASIAAALLIAISYWAASALFEALGSTGQLPPLLAAWAPNAIFALLAAFFFLKMKT